MKKLMKAFFNNGMTRREWYRCCMALVILPPIVTVVLFWLVY